MKIRPKSQWSRKVVCVGALCFFGMQNSSVTNAHSAGTPGAFYSIDWGNGTQTSNIIPSWNSFPFSDNRVLPDSEIVTLAAKAKLFTDTKPAGRKALSMHTGMGSGSNVLTANLSNHCWPDAGYAIVKDNVTRFINQYKSIGGQVDITWNDIESGSSVWDLGNLSDQLLDKIQADARYVTDIKPLLTSRGFTFTSPIELKNIRETSGEHGLKGLHIWNDVAAARDSAYQDVNIYGPLKSAYPNIAYACYERKRQNQNIPCPDMNGWTFYDFSMKAACPGTHQSPALYGWLWRGIMKQRPPAGLTSYPRTAFNGFRYSLNNMIACALADPKFPKVKPWITGKHYVGDGWGADSCSDGHAWVYAPVGNTFYYDEMIMHIGLCNPDGFLSWGVNIANATADYPYLNGLFKELDEVAGYPDRELIMTQVWSWSKPYVITGMKANGKNLWRVTPDVEVVSTTAFKTSNNPITFKAGSTTIIFPKGSTLLTPSIEMSKYGYWVTSPVLTSPTENGVAIPIKGVSQR